MKTSQAGGVSRYGVSRYAAGVILWALAAMPASLMAQTAAVSGSLSAFDVVNDSGQAVHGFEIRLEGALQGDLYYTMNGQRYGAAKVSADVTGVSVRYESPYDATSQIGRAHV